MTLASELRARWATPDGRRLAAAVLPRLLSGESLDGLPVATHDGRWDLRGMVTPRWVRGDPEPWLDAFVDPVWRDPCVSAGRWMDLDLSAADLESLRLRDTEIRNCKFDDAQCSGLDSRAIRVVESSFRRTILRRATLGGWYDGRWGHFEHVDFSRADMRSISSKCADFVDCDFSAARLSRYESGSASFVRCRFSGILSQVIFSAQSEVFIKNHLNSMEDVDLSAAELRWCEFRNLDLRRVVLPSREKHLIVRRPRDVIELALSRASTSDDVVVRSSGIKGYLRATINYLHPNAEYTIFDHYALHQMADGTDAIRVLLEGVARELGAVA